MALLMQLGLWTFCFFVFSVSLLSFIPHFPGFPSRDTYITQTGRFALWSQQEVEDVHAVELGGCWHNLEVTFKLQNHSCWFYLKTQAWAWLTIVKFLCCLWIGLISKEPVYTQVTAREVITLNERKMPLPFSTSRYKKKKKKTLLNTLYNLAFLLRYSNRPQRQPGELLPSWA